MNSAKNGRQVYCKVTDQYGHSVNSSAVAMYYFAITQQPVNGAGLYVATSVKAVGDGLSFRWYYKDPGMSAFKDSSLTTTSVTTVMNAAKHGRQLFCKVTDQYGHSIKSATVTLKTLVITQQPQNAVGGIASTTVRTTSDGLAYQWYYKDTSMSSFVKTDVKSATYSVSMNEDTHLRQVYCVITDQYGSTVTSDTATLYYLTITAQPKDVVSGRGALVTVSCEAAGEGLTYNWYRGLLTGSSEGSLHKGNASSFQRRLIDGDERDFYYCIVTDKYGNSVRSENIRIYFFSIYYPSPTTVRNSIADLSSTYKMIVRVESVEGLALTFDWFEADADGVFQPISHEYGITSTSGNTYNNSSIDLNTKGLTPRQYKCVITDPYGHTKSATWIFTK